MIAVSHNGPIVVIDDSDADRFILRRVLGKTSLPNTVIEFDGGRAFFEYLDRVEQNDAEAPAMVLTDINMPGLSGFDVISKIRERPAFEALAVVVMVTSSEATGDIGRAKAAGATHYIPKEAGIASFVRSFEATFTSV